VETEERNNQDDDETREIFKEIDEIRHEQYIYRIAWAHTFIEQIKQKTAPQKGRFFVSLHLQDVAFASSSNNGIIRY
jgi:hypothetical protein